MDEQELIQAAKDILRGGDTEPTSFFLVTQAGLLREFKKNENGDYVEFV